MCSVLNSYQPDKIPGRLPVRIVPQQATGPVLWSVFVFRQLEKFRPATGSFLLWHRVRISR